MATRTYYGTCSKSGKDEAIKKVWIQDEDLQVANPSGEGGESSFQFEKGDLLTVFFAQGNTVDEPRIVIYDHDPELEVSTNDDSGKFIKSLDNRAGMADAWNAGETLIFAYTQEGTSSTYYWELINAAHATTEVYGDTKLFEEDGLNNLLTQDKDSKNSQIALTPNTLKDFFHALGLVWTSAEQIEPQNDLGTLTLKDGNVAAGSVTITYPIDQKIQDYFNHYKPISHTGQLTNNGNGGEGEEHKTDPAEPFITRIVPDSLYFGNGEGLYYGTDPSNAQPRIILNGVDGDNQNQLLLGTGSGINGIVLNKGTKIKEGLEVIGGINATSTISALNEETPSNNVGFLTSGTIKEKNQLLSQRYSPKLKVVMKRDAELVIESKKVSKREGSSHIHLSVDESGWTPIGVVGYNLNYVPNKQPNPTNTADAEYCNVWECYLMYSNGNPTNTVEYSIYNMNSATVKVQMDVYVLYQYNLD